MTDEELFQKLYEIEKELARRNAGDGAALRQLVEEARKDPNIEGGVVASMLSAAFEAYNGCFL